RTEPAEIVAFARHLGLDDLRAELRHQRAAKWTRDDLRQFEHPEAVQRPWRLHDRVSLQLPPRRCTIPPEENVMTTYTRISADCHIDLPMLPTDLFTANASAVMKERMPYVVDGPDGPYWTCKNGGSFGLVCGVGPAGQKLVPGQNHRVDAMAA